MQTLLPVGRGEPGFRGEASPGPHTCESLVSGTVMPGEGPQDQGARPQAHALLDHPTFQTPGGGQLCMEAGRQGPGSGSTSTDFR